MHRSTGKSRRRRSIVVCLERATLRRIDPKGLASIRRKRLALLLLRVGYRVASVLALLLLLLL